MNQFPIDEHGENNPENSTSYSEKQAFDQERTDNASAPSAQRETNGDLFLSGRGARDQQIRQIRTGDQQDQSDNAHEREKRRGVSLAQIGASFRAGHNLHPHLQKLPLHGR